VTVRLWKHAAITGTIVDEMGKPAIGMQVRAFRREFAAGWPRDVPGAGIQPSAFTDDRGIHRLAVHPRR
jgi:uncharacterized OB-fold protein